MSPETVPEETVKAAAAWHERLHREVVSEETQRTFTAWLAQSVDRRTAYESVEKTWRQVHSTALDPR